jgi:hypothetical protein
MSGVQSQSSAASRQMGDAGNDRDLVEDRRGAIMVVGAFMAFFLTGALFMLMGIGNAVIYRERLQDAADAVAFTSAGIHARGMNLIVLINIIMAALMAVLVALKMLQLINRIILGACAIAIFTGWLTAACAAYAPWGGKIESFTSKAINVVEKALKIVLPVLSKTQVAIAIATPYVGVYKGNQVAKEYKPTVTSGFSVSPSMVPYFPKGKIGLPVEEMAWGKYCTKSAKLGVDMMFFWAPGAIKKILGWAAGKIVGSFPSYFCGSGDNKGADITQTLMNDLKNMPKDACKALRDNCAGDDPKLCAAGETTNCCKQSDVDDANKYASMPMGGKAQCEADQKAKMEEKLKGDGSAGLDPGKGWSAKTPKDIWSGAKHGDFWFSVWGVTTGDKKWPQQYDRGVSVATSKGLMPKPPSEWGNYRIAQAEFYCHKNSSNKKEQEWKKLKDDCVWNMWWRTRLRRVHLDIPDVVGWLTGKGLGWVQGKLGNILKDKLNTGGTLGSIFGQNIYSKATDWLKGAVVGKAGGIDKWIDSKFEVTSWEMIH